MLREIRIKIMSFNPSQNQNLEMLVTSSADKDLGKLVGV